MLTSFTQMENIDLFPQNKTKMIDLTLIYFYYTYRLRTYIDPFFLFGPFRTTDFDFCCIQKHKQWGKRTQFRQTRT